MNEAYTIGAVAEQTLKGYDKKEYDALVINYNLAQTTIKKLNTKLLKIDVGKHYNIKALERDRKIYKEAIANLTKQVAELQRCNNNQRDLIQRLGAPKVAELEIERDSLKEQLEVAKSNHTDAVKWWSVKHVKLLAEYKHLNTTIAKLLIKY